MGAPRSYASATAYVTSNAVECCGSNAVEAEEPFVNPLCRVLSCGVIIAFNGYWRIFSRTLLNSMVLVMRR